MYQRSASGKLKIELLEVEQVLIVVEESRRTLEELVDDVLE